MEKQSQKAKLQPNGWKKANVLYLLSFWWMNSIFSKGAKQTLKEDDMMELLSNDHSEKVCDKLERNWKKQLEKRKRGGKPSLALAFVSTYYLRFIGIGCFAVVEEALWMASPFFIASLVRYFEAMDTTPVSEAYISAALFSGFALSVTLCHHYYVYQVQRLGWHMRAASCGLMYKKTLRLSQKSLSQTTTGKIVNLGATDVLQLDTLPLFLHYIWISPLQIVLCVFFLWDAVGTAILAGMGVMTVIMVAQSLNGRIFGKLRMQTAVITDERIRFMNEVITGMRIIKMYTWEKPFAALIATLRKKEVWKVMWTSMLKAVNLATFACAPKIITCVTFTMFITNGGELRASQVFKVIGFLNVIRDTVGLVFPLAIETIAKSRISIKRIESFLLLDEIQAAPSKNSMNSRPENVTTGNCTDATNKKKSYVELKDFSGRWQSSTDDKVLSVDEKPVMTLKNINVRVEAGQLLAVIGPVGSGKSSFLSAILGELPTSSGDIEVNGKVTFTNQVPWVFAGTIRENILFGEDYDPVWFKKVIKACGLKQDLKLLSNGDKTLIGERGVTLSGGQKARVSLARAAYQQNADICLLDDPLSAVDAAVGNHIFEQCICGIMREKTRILVTHQLQLLQDVDQIIILKEGEIVGRGTYDELQSSGTDFAELLQERESDDDDDDVMSARHFSETDDEHTGLLKPPKVTTVRSVSTVSAKSEKEDAAFEEYEEEEMRSEGSLGMRIFWEYFRAGAGNFFLFVFLIMMIVSHVLMVLCEWWISIWTTEYEDYKENSLNFSQSLNFTNFNSTQETSTLSSVASSGFDTHFYLMMYAVLTIVTFFAVLIRAIMHFYVCVSSGIHLHNGMLKSVLRAPIRFFDTNPSGRILNRFSKDIWQIDDLLPTTFYDVSIIFGQIISIIILVMFINYFITIVVLPMIICFVWLRQYYVKTSRDIKRMEGATRSPVFSHLTATLQGLTTVRAFSVQNDFEEKFHEKQDLHSSAWFLFLCSGRWMGFRVDILSSLFITVLSFTSVMIMPIIELDPGQIGLMLTYSVLILSSFQWGVRQSAEMENMMTSVERIKDYSNIPPEAPAEVPEKKPPPDWPRFGVVTFDQVSFTYYKGGPNVLKKIRFNIKAKEKVGIVGRTGAGKSSLISALFRLSELSDGEILIDGIPITPLGLDDLRSSLSIIPQDPILFTGTMRRNLDPFSQYSDSDIWGALSQVQLKEVVESLPLRLDTELAESGSNFSVGQRQLVCLARAILRKCKILVIDEATANVDLRTDRLIQMTIREKFQTCTVLTIAHRINTIIDSDRVLVLDSGSVQEFDEPHILLQDPNSYFSNLVENMTPAERESLRNAAEEAYKIRNSVNIVLPEDFRDQDRSYLSRFAPTPDSYDVIQFETGL